MNAEGPPLEVLTHRLAECPPEFLAEPRFGSTGTVNVAAVVADLIRELGEAPAPEQLAAFEAKDAKRDRNRLQLVLIGSWLLHEAWFRQAKQFARPALEFLGLDLAELAGMAQAPKFISDPDRREELARLCLKRLGLRPAGESMAQAKDRLATLNTAERQRVIQAARAAEKRSREIRRKMAEEAARQAEAKYMPE